MNGKQRIEAALRGERADRIPVMLHNFLMAAREAGMTQRQFREDPAKIAEAFIRAVETYDYDGIVVDIDTATLAGAVGVPVDFPEDDPARCEGGCLPDLAAARDLPPPDVAANPRVQIWLEAVRLLKAHFGDEIYLRGNCDQAPFSLASMMRTPAEWMMDLLDEARHADVECLLNHCAEASGQFLTLMAATGADMLSNGDSPASPDLISPALYRTFAQPWERQLMDLAHALGKPYLLHICGNTTLILDAMLATGADVLELDYKTDVRAAGACFKDHAVFCGNLDPSGVLALGTAELVANKTRELLAVFADNPRFILNAGCAIPPATPPANLRAMLRAARESPCQDEENASHPGR
ncbi:MAG: uroporphyrinogen decarboxylase family protein [Verrucomicrobia bacterium]|nr:uroporphyrinogen decarboxylase family protein [Verrucomicrobiota bacterium]